METKRKHILQVLKKKKWTANLDLYFQEKISFENEGK